MESKIKRLAFLFTAVLSASACLAESDSLSLQQVIGLARGQSLAARQVDARKSNNLWQYRSFLANYKPQLNLNGILPGFTKSYIQVTQPDGSVAFQSVSNNNSVLSLGISQVIAPTGGSIFIQQELRRFDNFLDGATRVYNGIPVQIGISQPLFRFNALRWDRKISPLIYDEGVKQAIQDREGIAVTVAGLYFELLITQVNLDMAEKNLANNDTLYKIAIQKFDLGRISQNDLLQLQMNLLSSKKALVSARQANQIASLSLKTFLGTPTDQPLVLTVPSFITLMKVEESAALTEAFANRPDAIGFRRKKLEADRDLNEVKAENGLNANLNVSFGLSNRGVRIPEIYQRPQNQAYAEIQFTLPVLTWGRNKARLEVAKTNQLLAEQTISQDQLTFEQEVITQVTLVKMLTEQVKLTRKTDEIGMRRYHIAQERFILGNLSVTDLAIALNEKDQAKRDYILALRYYWEAYYMLRKLTLYDFEAGMRVEW